MKTGLLDRSALAVLLLALSALGQDADPDLMPEGNVTLDETPEMEETDMNETEAPADMMPVANVTVPTQSPTVPTYPPTTEDGCYTTLDAVYFLISDDDMLFQQKRFVICPGSVIEVGFLVPGVGIDQGQAPFIPRSNTEFLCGEDGKSENNCIIKGGDFGLIAVPVFFRQDLSVNNVQIKGFTFEGQVQYAAFVATAGDISFIDCVVRDSANFGPFVFNYDSSLDLGRRLDEDEEEEENPWLATLDYITKYREGTLPTRRLAQTENEETGDEALLPVNERGLQDSIFESTIRGCVFTNLQQVERKLGVEFGVISIKSPDHNIKIEDCTFSNNQYGNQELTPIGYGVLVQGAALSLHDVCFMNNDFRGNGAVLLEQTANPFAEGADFLTGNYATEDENVDCTFAAYFATDEDRRNSNYTCVPVQTDECGGEPVEIPIAAPSEAPDDSGASSSFSNLILAGSALFGFLALQ